MELSKQSPPVVWIDDSKTFSEIAHSWRQASCLAIDTEFERRTTFYPKFALLQVFDGEQVYLVDPLKVECPEVFRQILADPTMVKILHSAKEDLEVFYYSWDCSISGLFDTQVAYAFTNGTSSIGYANLVADCFGVQLAKEATQSDWLARPLSSVQLDYAAKDVIYLPEIYQKLAAQLAVQPYYDIFKRECQELCQIVKQVPNFEVDYRLAKEVFKLDARQLGLFKRLYQWREEVAIRDDRTRNHLAKDGVLVQLAMLNPDSKRLLKRLEGLHPRTIRQYGDQLIEIIDNFNRAPLDAPKLVANPRDLENMKTVSDQLLKAAIIVAKEAGIAPAILASKRMIRKIAYAYLAEEPFPEVWSGWRGVMLKPVFDPIISQFITSK